MKYAIVRIGGKQYTVKEGDSVDVERLRVQEGSLLSFDEVLLLVLDGTVRVGTPTLSDVRVVARVFSQIKADKINVARFKAKARYSRLKGFRAQRTKVNIEKITVGKQIAPKQAKVKRISKNKKPNIFIN